MKITPQDFERLYETSMLWNKQEWSDRLFRFDTEMPDKGWIFWVDSYVALMLCRQYCEDHGFDFYQTYDEVVMQWAFVTTETSHKELANA